MSYPINGKMVFVNWTPPYFDSKNMTGYRKLQLNEIYSLDLNEYSMVDYEYYSHQVAVINARKWSTFPTKLYTDRNGFNWYKKNNLLNLFDEIDFEVLENYKQNYSVNSGRFWASGKVYAICHEEPPFIFLDNDFILNSKPPEWIFEKDLVFPQWEIQRGDYFITSKMLNDFDLDIPNFSQNMMMPNTSFLYINNKELLTKLKKQHLDMVTKVYKKDIPDAFNVLSDQGLIGYISRELNLNVDTLEDMMYLAYHELDETVGATPMWVGESTDKEKLDYEHLWFGKYRLKVDKQYKEERIKEWKKVIFNSLI